MALRGQERLHGSPECRLPLPLLRFPGVAMEMGQMSRVVTIIEGIEVIEVTVQDPGGAPIEKHYYVLGEKYDSLREAMKAARRS